MILGGLFAHVYKIKFLWLYRVNLTVEKYSSRFCRDEPACFVAVSLETRGF